MDFITSGVGHIGCKFDPDLYVLISVRFMYMRVHSFGQINYTGRYEAEGWKVV